MKFIISKEIQDTGGFVSRILNVRHPKCAVETQHLEDAVFEIYLQTGAAPQARLFQENKKQATLGTHKAKTLTGLPRRKTEEFKFKRTSCFCAGAVVKNPPAGGAGEVGSIPGLGRSPEAGNGNPLQCSCLGNPRDRGAWWAAVHG